MIRVDLADDAGFDVWRKEARRLAEAGIEPRDILWLHSGQ